MSNDLSATQQRLLAAHVAYCAERSPFYRAMFAELGSDAAAIDSYAALEQLPFTTKAHVEGNEEAFLCVDAGEIADICMTSGTSGTPVAFAQSRADMRRLARNEELAMRCAGITSADRVLIAATLDRCFMAGIAYYSGLQQIGATTIRAGANSLVAVAQLLKTLRPSAVVGVPTFLLKLAEYMAGDGAAAALMPVQRLICIGEPVRRADLSLAPLGEQLEQLWQAQVYATYASTEMATTFCDCQHGCGGHVAEELMVVEIIDEHGRRVSDNTPGEVVATPLQVSAMPLLRFRTGDIAALQRQPCSCGRSSWRLGPILGRREQMLKYHGTTLYPPAIFAVLQQIDAVDSYYIEVYDDFALSDRIKVVVGSDEPTLSAAAVAERIAAAVRVKPQVEIAAAAQVRARVYPAHKRKPQQFFDYRRQRRLEGHIA